MQRKTIYKLIQWRWYFNNEGVSVHKSVETLLLIGLLPLNEFEILGRIKTLRTTVVFKTLILLKKMPKI